MSEDGVWEFCLYIDVGEPCRHKPIFLYCKKHVTETMLALHRLGFKDVE